MAQQHSDGSPAKLDTNDARGGRRVKGMTRVLATSMTAVIVIGIGFLVAYT